MIVATLIGVNLSQSQADGPKRLQTRPTSNLQTHPHHPFSLPSSVHQLSLKDNVPPTYGLRHCEALSRTRHHPRPAPVFLVRRAQYVPPQWSDPASPDICQTSHPRLNRHSTRRIEREDTTDILYERQLT